MSSSLADDIATYIGFGDHRAGTPAETRTADWFAGRPEQLGYTTGRRTFPIRTILDPGGRLTCGGHGVDVFPQWLPPESALRSAIVAPLLPLHAPAAGPSIRVMTKPAAARGNWGATQDAWVTEAAAKGAVALVAAPDDGSGAVYVSNQHDLRPLPIPVALVAPPALPPLTHASQSGLAASLMLTGTLTDTHAVNVVAHKPGCGRMLVISTPLTGWFTCGAERGPGIAILMRLAEALCKSKRHVLAIGTGSHEIGHLGMAHLLSTAAPDVDDVGFWLHLGASLAARKRDPVGKPSMKNLVGTKTSEAWVRDALGAHVSTYVDGSMHTPGESGQVIGAGFRRFAGMVGTFPGFHTSADRGEAIDYDVLERIASASEALLWRAAHTDLP